MRDAEKELEAERKKVDEMKRKYEEVCENCTSTEEQSKALIEKKKYVFFVMLIFKFICNTKEKYLMRNYFLFFCFRSLEQQVAEIKNAVSIQRQSENDANETVFELKEKLKENRQKQSLTEQMLVVQNRSCATIQNELQNVNET